MMKVPAPTAIIFDIDDTLYAEQSYTFSGYRAVANAFKDRLKPEFDLFEKMRELFNTPDRNRVFNVIAELAGITDPDSVVNDMVATFRNHKPAIKLFEQADESLTHLRGKYKLGAISDGYLVTQQAKVDALGLTERLDEIILTDQWGREYWKPHPRAFEEMSEKLNVPHSECVYVADNLGKDFLAPNQLGWLTIFITPPQAVHAGKQPPAGGEPHITIKTLLDLEKTWQ